MHLVGESSKAALQHQSSEKRSSYPIRRKPPPPSPPAPAPTTPPTRRSPHEPEHVLVHTHDFDKRALQHESGKVDTESILGPFWARDMDQVVQIKRDLLRRKANINLDWMPAHLSGPPPPSLPQHNKKQRRQTAAEETCYVGNQDLSCYPTTGTTIVQNDWSRFIWNANYPLFAQRGYVDVYLFQQDTDQLVTSWTSQDNGQGRLSFEPNDKWWANRTAANNIQPNQNISWPFYFVVLASGEALTGTTSRLATFTAVQTTLPYSIAVARASQSAASSSASAASAASASAASASALSATARSSSASPTQTGSNASVSALQSSLSAALESSLRASGLSGTETLQGTTTATLPNGSLVTATATAQANGGRLGGSSNNGNSNGLALPTYAIVLISVLGFLAVVAAMAGAYFIMAALRRRRQRQGADGSHRSSSPMMAAAAGSLAGRSLNNNDAGYAGETSHMLEGEEALGAGAGAGGAGAGAGAGLGAVGGAAMIASHSRSSRYSEEQPFTSDEASRMADAFRNALRNPEFAPALGGESSGADGESPNEGEGGGGSRASMLLREELAAEGKDLRSVGDRKKPTWHEE